MAQLITALQGGWTIVQTYRPMWPGGSPRDLYHLERAGEMRGVRQGTVVRALHTHKLESIATVDRSEWRLRSCTTKKK